MWQIYDLYSRLKIKTPIFCFHLHFFERLQSFTLQNLRDQNQKFGKVDQLDIKVNLNPFLELL